MLIPFNPLKVAQATAVLLKTEPSRRMGRLRVLKLLYIADRELLQKRGRPITGDRPVAMDNGPVLSGTYDLIKGSDFYSAEWGEYLLTEGRDVVLRRDPGVGKLSRHEISHLQGVASRFQDSDDWEVAEYTHTFEEWKKNQPPKGSSKPIPMDDLLAATGRTNDKDAILEAERCEIAFSKLVESVEK